MSQTQRTDRCVGYRWMLATTLGLALSITGAGFLVGIDGIYRVLRNYGYAFAVRAGLVFGLAGLVVGLVVGVGQWLVLRSQIKRAASWIWATMIGLGLGNAVGVVVLKDLVFITVERTPIGSDSSWGRWTILFWAAAGALCGLILGTAQWLVLRRQVRRAGRWIVVNIVSWAIAAPMGQLAGAAVADIFFRDNLLLFFSLSPPIGDAFLGVLSTPGYLVTAIIAASTTGVVIAHLLKKSQAESV